MKYNIDIIDSEPSTVVSQHTELTTLVALFDGSGSWGTGVEAASWCRDHLHDFFKNFDEFSPEDLRTRLLKLIATIPSERCDLDWGWSFSGVVIVLRASQLTIVAAGLFGIWLSDSKGTRPLFKPRMIVDLLIAKGHLTRDEVHTYPHRQLCVGPFLGERDITNTETLEVLSSTFEADGTILIAHQEVFDRLEYLKHDWTNTNAREIRRIALDEGIRSSAIILLQHFPDDL